MADDRQELRATLTELHRQLEAAENLDPESETLLRQVMADIEQALSQRASAVEAAPAKASTRRSLARRLADATRGFEATHPTLSAAIGGVVDALAQIGI